MNEVTHTENSVATSNETETEATTSQKTAVKAVPVTDSLMEKVRAAVDFSVNVKPVKFHFKKSKDENGVETKRDTLELAIPYPSVEGIVHILENGGKGLELLVDAVESIVTAHIRSLISDDVRINAANLPLDQVSWDYIANMPKAQRTGGGIPKETWEEFAVDYIAVMPDAAGKTIEQATRAANLLKGKFSAVRTSKPVVEMLVGQLAIYAGSSQNAEEFSDCIEFLLNKGDQLLNLSDEDLLQNL